MIKETRFTKYLMAIIVLLYQDQLLHFAAKGGLSDLMKILVSQDVNINAVDQVRLN